MPADDINAMIAVVEGIFNTQLANHPRNIQRANYTIPINDSAGNPYTEATPLLPLPVDLAQLIRLSDVDENLYKQYPAGVIPTNSGNNFISRGDCLHLYPTPARGTTFYIDYHAFIEPLVQPNDSNWLSTYFSDVYLYGCLKEATIYLKNTENLALWSSEFDRRMGHLIIQGWEQNIAAGPASVNE